MDSDLEVCKFSSARKTAIVRQGQLPERVPFENVSFELVVMTDVLEHLDRDEETLTVLRQRLKPGGWLLATVPAFPFLWSAHDATHRHQRRYVAGELLRFSNAPDSPWIISATTTSCYSRRSRRRAC